ncbi:hypothetical protein CARUB_v10010832mg [Capsella rubella]|uniref:Plant thionin family protein n=1 Tax=Capsella rubella TaxID=81985 RepID=R0IHQ0_9BRAS|nr:hypothetical protein CARUB_v10010832mg [Capsella rubella]
MATQALKKTCRVFMVIAILTMMFSADIAHSNNVGMCVKHCLPQCLKSANKHTPSTCEGFCKKSCNKQVIGKEESFIPRTDEDSGIIGKIGEVADKACDALFNNGCNWKW